ncbi:MAG: hypothetical protein H6797_01930 [Candidatus Nomurabacteria bacterium]|nr:MAG: hypothetical protein H6797_01930 [Candidatus Nomurabacteria bacterium]
MGYTVEDNGNRRYKINKNREIVRPSTGQDFCVDRVKAGLGRTAVMRGRIFHPEGGADEPLNVVAMNGWSAPAASYYEGAGKMASMGIATAVYDTIHLPSIKDFKDSLRAAEMGGIAMIDIMGEVVGDNETALIGHSTGAITAWRVAQNDDRPSYVVGEAPAGIEHRNMGRVYLKENLKDIVQNEFMKYFKHLFTDKFGLQVAGEFLVLNTTEPTRLIRQAWMLSKGPDLAPMMATAHEKGMLNGVILHGNDKFFHMDKQIEIIDRKKHLFDLVRIEEDSTHLHPNMYPTRNAEIRVEVLNTLRGIRKLGSQALSS